MESQIEDYPDLVQLNTKRVLVNAIGRATLERVASAHLFLRDTALTIFEANGDYATAARPRGWCRLVDERTRAESAEDPMNAIGAGRWTCRTACRRAALEAMESGRACDQGCSFGMRVYAVPIRADGEIVGSISMGHGSPPGDDERLGSMAERLGLTIDQVHERLMSGDPPRPEADETAQRAVAITAELLGALVASQRRHDDSDRAEAAFVNILAHDLRNPLSAVLVGAETLQRSSAPQGRDASIASLISRTARTMTRMVDDLLAMARARHGRGISLSIARCDVQFIVEDVISEMRLANPRSDVRAMFDGDTEVACDADRVREVVANLIGNAIRHGAGTPAIVRVSGRASELEVCVANGGPAIPRASLSTIFDPFTQGPSPSGRDRANGVGLGLYIAREVVAAHGGRIDVESSEADGTRVTVRLPRR